MKRYHEEAARIQSEWKKHHRDHVEKNVELVVCGPEDLYHDPWNIACPCDTQPGRFRKKKAFDCGIARCYGCHSDKFPKREITYQEWAANLKLEEGTDEAG